MRRVVLSVVLLLVCFAPSKRALGAGDKEVAANHFKRGVKLFRGGAVEGALVEFQRAYDLLPNYRVLYNIGQSAALTKDYARAIVTLRRYLKEGGAQIKAARRQAVAAELTRLAGFVGSIRIQCSVDGALLTLDGRALGKSPLQEPVLVNAGYRTFRAVKRAFAPAQRYIAVAGGERKTVSFELTAPKPEPTSRPLAKTLAPGPPELPPRQPPKPRYRLGKWFWTAAISTAAFAIATGVTGGLTLGARDDFEKELATVPTTSAAIEDARSTMESLALATDILIGATVAATALAGYLFFADRKRVKERANEQLAGVRVLMGPQGVAIVGTF